MIGPVGAWHAADGATIAIEAAGHTTGEARLFWRKLGDGRFSEAQVVRFNMENDGAFHTTRVRIGEHPGWNGTIIQLRLDPTVAGTGGEWIRVKSVVVEK